MDKGKDDREKKSESDAYINSVPPYVDYTERDAQYDQWLTEQYKVKYTAICNDVKKILELGKTKESPYKFFTPHGAEHYQAVETNLHRLIPGDKFRLLSEAERFYLLGAAWLHDMGMFIYAIKECELNGKQIRDRHHELSQQLICEDYKLFGVEEGDATIFGQLAYFHRKKVPIEDCPEVTSGNRKGIRLRLLAAYLRLADGLDIEQNRVPDEAYAIVMTYGIPEEQKMHWIRSKLVKGVIVDSEKSKLTAIVKYPTNLDEFIKLKNKNSSQKKEFITKIHLIYKNAIVNEIRNELASVKDVLIKHKITSFIKVDYVIENAYFKQNLLQQIWIAVDADIFLQGPSSSVVFKIVLETIDEIISAKRKDIEKYSLEMQKKLEENRRSDQKDVDKSLREFIQNMYETVKDNRRCHFGLIKFLGILETFWGARSVVMMKSRKKLVCKELLNYINNGEVLSRIRPDIKGRIDCVEKQIKEYEIKKEYDRIGFIRIYVRALLVMATADKVLIRNNAKEFIKNRGFECYSTWVCRDFIKCKVDSILHVQNAETGSSAQDECGNGETKLRISRLGILLYGFSTYVMRTLCGFRDYIISEIIKEIVLRSDNTFPPHLVRQMFCTEGKSFSFENEVSDFFDIYVMEGQPKNTHSWTGVVHHDGYSYCKKIKKRGFQRVSLVADALAGSLLSQYYKIPSKNLAEIHAASEKKVNKYKDPKDNSTYAIFPRIHFLVHGANGLSQKYVYHSAGHLTAICCALQKGRTDIVLTTQTSKYLHEKRVPGNDDGVPADRSMPQCSPRHESKDGWTQLRSYPEEKIRKTIFIPYDKEYFDRTQTIYTPTEDKIRYSEIDYVITEKSVQHTRSLAYDVLTEKADFCPPPVICTRGPKQLINIREPNFDLDEKTNKQMIRGYDDAGRSLVAPLEESFVAEECSKRAQDKTTKEETACKIIAETEPAQDL